MSHAGSIRRELLKFANNITRFSDVDYNENDIAGLMREAAGVINELVSDVEPKPQCRRCDCKTESRDQQDPVLEAIRNAPVDDEPEDEPASQRPGAVCIVDECHDIRDMLLEKNASYGNSALDPLRIFSTASASEQIRVRIDDKISRIARGKEIGEDTVLDLIGYLVLLRIAMRNAAEKSDATDGRSLRRE
jgi:hypothetical protein